MQITPDIQPHRSVALLLLLKTTLVLGPDELVLDTHVASMALHGRSSVASAALPLHGVVSIGASVPVFK